METTGQTLTRCSSCVCFDMDMDKLGKGADANAGWTMNDEYDAEDEDYGDDRPDADKVLAICHTCSGRPGRALPMKSYVRLRLRSCIAEGVPFCSTRLALACWQLSIGQTNRREGKAL